MPIRKVKFVHIQSEYWTDVEFWEAVPDAWCREFYLALLSVADDSGYLRWDVKQLGAQLYTMFPPVWRHRNFWKWATHLISVDRFDLLECGIHAVLPKRAAQAAKKPGGQEHHVRDEHEQCLAPNLAKSAPNLAKGTPNRRRTTPSNGLTEVNPQSTEVNPQSTEDDPPYQSIPTHTKPQLSHRSLGGHIEDRSPIPSEESAPAGGRRERLQGKKKPESVGAVLDRLAEQGAVPKVH